MESYEREFLSVLFFFIGDPSEKDTEKITSLWHTSLFNAHIDTQR